MTETESITVELTRDDVVRALCEYAGCMEGIRGSGIATLDLRVSVQALTGEWIRCEAMGKLRPTGATVTFELEDGQNVPTLRVISGGRQMGE